MALTLITISNVSRALRGDLTKWMQEIATGVYVGDFNARVREEIWKRVKDSIKNGEATLTYKARTELGYSFETINTNRQVIDWDGIPLVLIPRSDKEDDQREGGFSLQGKYRKAKNYSSLGGANRGPKFLILDIETDGLDPKKNRIIEIGAIEVMGSRTREYDKLISYDGKLPSKIVELTGIDDQLLRVQGKDLRDSLIELLEFVSENPIVGYNISFDISFLNKKLKEMDLPLIKNKTYDLMRFVKKEKMYLDNYKLETVLKAYGINDKLRHRAIGDCRLIYQLSNKVKKFQDQIKTNG